MTSPDQSQKDLSVTCCIAGGGPAGMMLGLLLARAGVDVLVLEKHDDFLRDFRGDTLHPSTLEVMHEIGLSEKLLALPHQKLEQISATFGGTDFKVADFRHLPVHHPFIALMPQWDFLACLAREAGAYPNFALKMGTRAVQFVQEGERVTGVLAEGPGAGFTIRADLVVAADGRTSTLREASGLRVRSLGAPIDVFWFRIPRNAQESAESAGRFEAGQVLVRIFRGDYWQCGYVIGKGSADRIRSEGIKAFRSKIAALLPAAARDLGESLRSFDDVKLLSVSLIGWNNGFARAFLRSAMPRMPCRRSAASASILRSRMRSPQPIS